MKTDECLPRKIIAIDYDGVLVEDHSNVNIVDANAREGAREFVDWLRYHGFHLTLFTARPPYQRDEIIKNLHRQNIFLDAYGFYVKPVSSLYIDDKAIFYEANWNKMKDFIIKKWNIKDDTQGKDIKSHARV